MKKSVIKQTFSFDYTKVKKSLQIDDPPLLNIMLCYNKIINK